MKIFCDFDGTITKNDNIIEIMKRFAPQEWVILKDQVLNRSISVKEGVSAMFNLLPASKKADIASYILNQAEIRDGFSEFINYAEKESLDYYIVSGGIDFFVYPLLESKTSLDRIYCNRADFTGETIQIQWPHSCENGCENDCGCCKPSVIRNLAKAGEEVIVIGDSVTDLEAAKLADLVIARDYLLEQAQKLDLPYVPFETFFDVISILEKRKVTV